MFELLNQYSYVWIGLSVLLAALAVLRRGLRLAWHVILPVEAALAAVLVVALLILRPGAGDVNSAQAAEIMLANGRPTLLEFFSNYCTGCIAVRPAVEQLVAGIKEDFNILRVDIHTDTGRTLRETLGFSYTPEFIVFDTTGNEIWREHFPPTSDIIQAARQN